jgi:hypothetical protein
MDQVVCRISAFTPIYSQDSTGHQKSFSAFLTLQRLMCGAWGVYLRSYTRVIPFSQVKTNKINFHI